MGIKDFCNILIIFIFSIIVTIIIPGAISSINNTFDQSTFQRKLPSDIQKVLLKYQGNLDSVNKEINLLNGKLRAIIADSSSKSSQFDILIRTRQFLEQERDKIPKPINLIPFYLNPQMLLWLGIYSAILVLLYLIQKNEAVKVIVTRHSLGFAALLYVFYEWPLWIRNFVLHTRGRTVYAYPNWDIDKFSFFYQELIIFGFCFLISQLISTNVEIIKKKEPLLSQGIDLNKFLLISNIYSACYRNWLLYSTIRAFGFISFTHFFWHLVIDLGDQRYLISAVNAHLIWALTWVSLSFSLFKVMRLHDRAKRELLVSNPDENTIKILFDYQPASNMTIVLSGIASLITFLSPIIKIFISK